MVDKNELYPVNTIPPISWALDLYFKNDTKYKRKDILELTFPSGKHKEKLQTKGEHQITLWYSERNVYVRARCLYQKGCSFNSDRIDGHSRSGLMSLGWEGTDSRSFFKAITRWLLKLDLDYVLLIRALSTVCDKYVKTPLTTQYGKTFAKFDEYRRNKWPEDATPNDRARFLEEILVRVSFWIQSAAEVDALKIED